MDKSKYGVHRTHCCINHGCKYGYEDCPVTNGIIKQDHLCQDCCDDGDSELTLGQLITLKDLSDAFNEKYYSAVETSDANEYFDAALIGRQIVDYLGKQGIIKDSKK